MRKRSNLKPTQDANEARRLKMIDEALVVLHHEKVSYPDVTSLAKRVAAMVSLQEKSDHTVKRSGISYTTLLRNMHDGSAGPYRLQLEMFQRGAFDPTKTNKHLTRKDVEAYISKYPALQAYIATKDLEIANLKSALEEDRREMTRVKTHLLSQSQGTAQIPDIGQLNPDELQQAKLELTLTCTWIERFLRDQEWVQIDEENEVVRNMTKRGYPPVAEKTLFGPFFKAMKIRRQGRGQDE